MAAPVPLDRITLTGITGYGHHGVFPTERERGQPFVVDLTCQLDLARGGGRRRSWSDDRLRRSWPRRWWPTWNGTRWT